MQNGTMKSRSSSALSNQLNARSASPRAWYMEKNDVARPYSLSTRPCQSSKSKPWGISLQNRSEAAADTVDGESAVRCRCDGSGDTRRSGWHPPGCSSVGYLHTSQPRRAGGPDRELEDGIGRPPAAWVHGSGCRCIMVVKPRPGAPLRFGTLLAHKLKEIWRLPISIRRAVCCHNST